MSAVYTTALRDVKHATVNKQLQRLWLAEVRTNCVDANCLNRAYTEQMSLLQDPIVTTLAGTNFNHDRMDYGVASLANGTVLLMGGNDPDATGKSGPVESAEIYDPLTGRFATSGSLAATRQGHTATLLPNGGVLFSGGSGNDYYHYLATAELYDLGAGTFTATGSLVEARRNHTATLLQNGKVLLLGTSAGELYDPTDVEPKH